MGIYITLKNFLYWKIVKYLANPKKVVTINGNRMHLDKTDSMLLSVRKNYESNHMKVIEDHVKSGDTVIDVGAHIGYFTLRMAKLVGKNGKVIAFEPNPESFKILKRNIEENGYNNVILENKALSSGDKRIKLFFSETNRADSRMYQPPGEKQRTFAWVPALRLDDYIKQNKIKPSFLKIDVRGAEGIVFKGMKNFLKSRTNFTTEYHPRGMKTLGHLPEDFIKLIKEEGYTIYDISRKKRFNQEIANYLDINRYFTTLLCKP